MLGDAYRKVLDLEIKEAREIAKGYSATDTWRVIHKFNFERNKFDDFEFLVYIVINHPGLRVDTSPEHFETRLRAVGNAILMRYDLPVNFRTLTESTNCSLLCRILENESIFVKSEY
jgi:hypothetical protein